MKFLIVLLLLFTACSSKQEWSSAKMRTESPQFDSTRLLYRSKNKISGIDLHHIKTQEDSLLYLEIHGLPLTTPHLSITIEGQTTLYIATLHAGGQRLSLPQEPKEALLTALKDKKRITLQIEGYREEIKKSF